MALTLATLEIRWRAMKSLVFCILIGIQLTNQLPVKESSTEKSVEHGKEDDKPQDLQNIIGKWENSGKILKNFMSRHQNIICCLFTLKKIFSLHLQNMRDI